MENPNIVDVDEAVAYLGEDLDREQSKLKHRESSLDYVLFGCAILVGTGFFVGFVVCWLIR